MATTKLTVTVPDDLAVFVRGEVEAGRFESVSAYITRAAEALRDFDPLDLLIAGLIAESGEPDEVAEAWADEALAKARIARRAADGGGPGTVA